MMELIVIIVIISLVLGSACVILFAFLLNLQDDGVEEDYDLDDWVKDRNDVIF